MNGMHDLGGLHWPGRIESEPDEPVFHARWEGRVIGMALSGGSGSGGVNLDAARHRGSLLDPMTYFGNGYYGRWLAAFEMTLEEEGVLAPGELDARVAGRPAPAAAQARPERRRSGGATTDFSAIRTVSEPPAYTAGQAIITRNHQPSGHTRLPAYSRSRRGVIRRVHPAMVFPDTNAHGLGENPQYVYTVEFDGQELWGDAAEPGTTVLLDLFESYLKPA